METIIYDTSSEWNVPEKLIHLHLYLDKTIFPIQCHKAWASLTSAHTGYVEETYDWAVEAYSRSNWRHHLALISLILFTLLLPCISLDGPTRDSAAREQTAEDTTRKICSWPWVVGNLNKKGMKLRPQFITMLMTLIMAILDPSSPLMIWHTTEGGFGGKWSDKHGMESVSVFMSCFSMGANITVLSSKYIHLTTLIQIGIVKAKTAGSLLSKPMLGSTCEGIPQYELKALYDQVMGHLRQP